MNQHSFNSDLKYRSERSGALDLPQEHLIGGQTETSNDLCLLLALLSKAFVGLVVCQLAAS